MSTPTVPALLREAHRLRRHLRELKAEIDLGPGGTRQFGLDRGDRLAADTDIGNPAIRQRAATNDKVEIHLSSSHFQNHPAMVAQKTACRSRFFQRPRKVPSGGNSLYKPPFAHAAIGFGPKAIVANHGSPV